MSSKPFEPLSSAEDEFVVSDGEQRSTWRDVLKPKKTIQIAVSGEVKVTLPEIQIIDTHSFQRMRRVRQLGAACLVYPTAMHTRFDHSLGTLEMVWRMIQSITGNQHNNGVSGQISPRQKCLARIYALVHDVPHIPFGHTMEDELGIFERHDKNLARIERFLGPKSDIGQIIIRHFGQQFHEDLLRLYRWDEKIESWDGDKGDIFVHDLVSNTVCADLLDYLRRDDFFCNLGVSIRYQFLNYLYINKESDSDVRRIFIRLSKTEGTPRRDLLSDLCRLLQARYLVAERVYFHHAKITAGAMLGRAIQEARLTKGIDDQPELTEEKMYEHSDDSLVDALKASENEVARRLSQAYSDRALYEVWGEYRQADIEKTQGKGNEKNAYDLLKNTVMNSSPRRLLENLLTELTFTDQGDILFYAPDRRMNSKEARMRVLWKGQPVEFKEIDDPIARANTSSVLDAHARLWSMRVLARRGLDPKVRDTAQKFVEAEFFTLDAIERNKLRRSLCKSVVRRASVIGKWPIHTDGAELDARFDKAAERLVRVYEPSEAHEETTNSVAAHLDAIRAEFFSEAIEAKPGTTVYDVATHVSLPDYPTKLAFETRIREIVQSYYPNRRGLDLHYRNFIQEALRRTENQRSLILRELARYDLTPMATHKPMLNRERTEMVSGKLARILKKADDSIQGGLDLE